MSSNESIVFDGQYRVQEYETISEVLTVTTIPKRWLITHVDYQSDYGTTDRTEHRNTYHYIPRNIPHSIT